MQRANKLWLWLAGGACAACCAIPLMLLTGVSLTSFAILQNGVVRELLLCVVPLAAIGAAAFFFFRRRKLRSCCASPKSSCSTDKCGV
jgi:hypothetical protein